MQDRTNEPESPAKGSHDLFVALNVKALGAPENPPPYYGELHRLTENLNERTLRQFLAERYAWHPYPVLSVQFSSMSVFSDLRTLAPDTLRRLIEIAVPVCVGEVDDRFVYALGLLMILCDAMNVPSPSPALAESILQLKEKTQKLREHDDNAVHWYNCVAEYVVRSGTSQQMIGSKELRIHDK